MSRDLTIEDVGLVAESRSEMSPAHAQKVAAALDSTLSVGAGDVLPLLWHWTYFTPAVPTHSLGLDGHPRLAAGGPTEDLPRRMWVGGRVDVDASLVIGTPALRRSSVAKVEEKVGRSGRLVLATVYHEVEQEGRVALRESQDIVYRAPSTNADELPVGSHREYPPAGGWGSQVTVDSVCLFRFSAVTFNSHRIHYDRTYAVDVEGYPDLVVHGPLTAILLAHSNPAWARETRCFKFRASAPLFANCPFSIVGADNRDQCTIRAVRNDGEVAMTAELER